MVLRNTARSQARATSFCVERRGEREKERECAVEVRVCVCVCVCCVALVGQGGRLRCGRRVTVANCKHCKTKRRVAHKRRNARKSALSSRLAAAELAHEGDALRLQRYAWSRVCSCLRMWKKGGRGRASLLFAIAIFLSLHSFLPFPHALYLGFSFTAQVWL